MKRGTTHRKWSKKVIKRSSKCDVCNEHDTDALVAHHLESWHSNEELRYDLNNGVTLCIDCHIMFHCDYKRSFREATTAKDYMEFKSIAQHFLNFNKTYT